MIGEIHNWYVLIRVNAWYKTSYFLEHDRAICSTQITFASSNDLVPNLIHLSFSFSCVFQPRRFPSIAPQAKASRRPDPRHSRGIIDIQYRYNGMVISHIFYVSKYAFIYLDAQKYRGTWCTFVTPIRPKDEINLKLYERLPFIFVINVFYNFYFRNTSKQIQFHLNGPLVRLISSAVAIT